MKKTQIILVVVVIVAIGILYSLPRVVVDNEENSENIGQEDVAASDSVVQAHDVQLPETERGTVSGLIANLEKAESKEKFTIFADSLAAFYQKAGMYDSAAYYLGSGAEQFSDLALKEKAGNAYYEAYGFAMDQGKMNDLAEKTRHYLNQVLEANPERLDLKTKVAMTYVSSSNPMQGIMMIREVLEEDPQNEEAIYNMGVLSMQSGQYKRAVERFEDLVGYYPDNVQGQFYLGVSYFEAKQKKKAKNQFQKVKDMTEDPMILSSIDNYLGQL
ncbi:peptidase [Echinicola strongylocentroti]|uniref:Peptidase n=1 Tax=Echinicola strongylocentroti TaxID=1795355 RepID=A0A2Z4IID3_9BACT|nr:tetratricopeptide repeat protein [Echinicola strongylocentroti]AWW30891.1 peptidase [Echinicola strongylocentroti]